MGSDYKFLLNCEHALEDSSPSGHVITPSGNAAVSTAQVKFGSQSLIGADANDIITIPDSTDWGFGGNDFTIDGWIYKASGANQPFVMYQQAEGESDFIKFYSTATDINFSISFLDTEHIQLTYTHTITTDVWHHVAAVRHGDKFILFYDGIAVAKATSAGLNIPRYLVDVEIKPQSINSGTTYIDGLRVLNGRAAWTNNFTPPTRPYLEFIAEGIREKLLAKSAVFDLVGTSIYPGVAPTSAPDSYIVMSKISAPPVHVLGGTAGLVFEKVQVSSWARTVRDSEILAKEVKGSLDGKKGVLGDNYAQHIIMEDEGNEIVESEANRKQRAFGIRQDYTIAHSE